MVCKQISIEYMIIIVTLKEEKNLLRKIRNAMLIRYGISVTRDTENYFEISKN